jgi:hypothetical protein
MGMNENNHGEGRSEQEEEIMQKTIRLSSSDYRLHDGRVEVLGYDSEIEDWVWRSTRYKIGRRAVLRSVDNVSPDALRSGDLQRSWGLEWNLDGVAGNSDHKIRRIEGWRGTTDNRSVYAHGRVRITAIRELRSGQVAVTVRTDRAAD